MSDDAQDRVSIDRLQIHLLLLNLFIPCKLIAQFILTCELDLQEIKFYENPL